MNKVDIFYIKLTLRFIGNIIEDLQKMLFYIDRFCLIVMFHLNYGTIKGLSLMISTDDKLTMFQCFRHDRGK